MKPTTEQVQQWAGEAGLLISVYRDSIAHVEAFAALAYAAGAADMQERCAKVCEELGDHWSAYKDTALLNGDIELSNAASGESRAAEAIATVIRALGDEE